jgi:predicted dehydrogenase
MSPIRVAIIGGGHLGKIHTRLLLQQKGIRVVAVAEQNPAARQQISNDFSLPTVADYKALIPEIEAAVIATPTRTHFEIASDLIPHGIHLLIEKPLTDSAATAQTLAEMADRYHSIIQVGHVERFNPAFREALNHIGQPKFVTANRLSGYTFRSTDIGVVHDLMIHDIDLVNNMFNGPLIETRATGISIFGGQEDIAQARLHFACGGVANLAASRCSFKNERSLQIFGTEGYASVDLAEGKLIVVSIPDPILSRKIDFQNLQIAEQNYIRTHLFDSILPKQEITVEKINAIEQEQENWLEAIRFGFPPRISVESGRQAVEIAQHILESLASHRWSQTEPATTGPYSLMPQRKPATVTLERKAA